MNLLKINNKYCKKYINYVKWSFLSNFLVSIESAISTDAMINVVSNTDDNFRMLNYLGKDILGQAGSVLYMSKIANKSDKTPEKFLVYADIMQQFSFVTMCSTHYINGSYFLLLASSSNMMSNISFTSYGAINAKCIQNISSNNIGEIYSKLTTVNTIASTLGLSTGIFICSVVPDYYTRSLFIPVLGIGRIITYRLAIKDLIKE
jgi:hypothetical protein